MTEHAPQTEIEKCKDCPPESTPTSNHNAMYFAVLAFMALVGLSVAYTFLISGPSDVPAPTDVQPLAAAQDVTVTLQGFRYNPDPVQVKAGSPIKFTVTRVDEEGCGNAISFYSLGKSAPLPKGQPVTFDLPALQKGQALDFGCSMRMVTGKIVAV